MPWHFHLYLDRVSIVIPMHLQHLNWISNLYNNRRHCNHPVKPAWQVRRFHNGSVQRVLFSRRIQRSPRRRVLSATHLHHSILNHLWPIRTNSYHPYLNKYNVHYGSNHRHRCHSNNNNNNSIVRCCPLVFHRCCMLSKCSSSNTNNNKLVNQWWINIRTTMLGF